MVIDSQDLIYIVDMTGRIQVFDTEGKVSAILEYSVHRQRQTNRPGIGPGRQHHGGRHPLLPHLFYSPTGTLQEDKTIGGTNGQAPVNSASSPMPCRIPRSILGQRYGEFDRVQLFDSDRNFLVQFGKHAADTRIQSPTVDRHR